MTNNLEGSFRLGGLEVQLRSRPSREAFQEEIKTLPLDELETRKQALLDMIDAIDQEIKGRAC